MIFQGQSLKRGLFTCGSTGADSKATPSEIPLINAMVRYIQAEKKKKKSFTSLKDIDE